MRKYLILAKLNKLEMIEVIRRNRDGLVKNFKKKLF